MSEKEVTLQRCYEIAALCLISKTTKKQNGNKNQIAASWP